MHPIRSACSLLGRPPSLPLPASLSGWLYTSYSLHLTSSSPLRGSQCSSSSSSGSTALHRLPAMLSPHMLSLYRSSSLPPSHLAQMISVSLSRCFLLSLPSTALLSFYCSALLRRERPSSVNMRSMLASYLRLYPSSPFITAEVITGMLPRLPSS